MAAPTKAKAGRKKPKAAGTSSESSGTRANGKALEPSAKPAASGYQVSLKDIKKATGSSSEAFQLKLFTQAVESVRVPSSAGKKAENQILQAVLETLRSIAPRSELEGMLAAQMIATHDAAMECLRRAMLSVQTFEERDQNLKHAAKLMSVYERQLAALDKHRGKGQQKITVEHVTVEAGGQAIVGNVNTEASAKSAVGESTKALPDDSVAEALSRDLMDQVKTVNKAAVPKR